MVVKSSLLIKSSDYVGGITCDYVECIIHAYHVAESPVTMLGVSSMLIMVVEER